MLALTPSRTSLSSALHARRPCAVRSPAGTAPARWAVPARRAAARPVAAMTQLASGIKLDSNPSEEELKRLGVKAWPTWGCDASKFPWTYDSAETAFVLKGRVIVTPDGGEPVEVKAGDLVTFPAGMSCVWDVKEAIHKHYNFH